MLLIKNYLNMDKQNKPATNLQKRPPTKPFDMELIKALIAERLWRKRDDIGDNISLIQDLGADSLDTVELVMAFEEEFGCEIPDEAAEKILTVKDAIDYLSKNA